MPQTEEEIAVVNDIAGYSLFRGVEDSKVQAYNRCVIMANLSREDKKELASEYFSHIQDIERIQLMSMAMYIKEHSFESVLKEIRNEEK